MLTPMMTSPRAWRRAAGLGDTGDLSVDASGNVVVGGGVQIGGTGAANLLDDYEEGTWTPALIDTGGGLSITYDSGGQVGWYRKIGSLVFVTGFIQVATASGGSGSVQISGLPFATASGNEGIGAGQVGYLASWGTVPTNVEAAGGGQSVLSLQREGASIAASVLNGDEDLRFSCVYIAA